MTKKLKSKFLVSVMTAITLVASVISVPLGAGRSLQTAQAAASATGEYYALRIYATYGTRSNRTYISARQTLRR